MQRGSELLQSPFLRILCVFQETFKAALLFCHETFSWFELKENHNSSLFLGRKAFVNLLDVRNSCQGDRSFDPRRSHDLSASVALYC